MAKSYFSYYPQIQYQLDSSGPRTVLDITRRVAFKAALKQIGALYLNYSIKDEDTPETIAYKLYQSAQYYWVVLLFNNILDPYLDWPLSTNNFTQYITAKYPGQALIFPHSNFIISDVWVSPARLFPVGSIVSQVQGGSTLTATVSSWDPTYGVLIVNNLLLDGTASSLASFIAGTAVTLKDELGNAFSIIPTRLVTNASNAIHHFEFLNGKILDPLAEVPYTDELTGLQVQPTIPNTSLVGYSSIQNTYANSGNLDATILTQVSLYDYEDSLNESKRNIQLLRSDFLAPVLQQLETIFN